MARIVVTALFAAALLGSAACNSSSSSSGPIKEIKGNRIPMAAPSSKNKNVPPPEKS